ncbi:hypothetical protein ABC365_15450 [Brevundimonas sp. 3P9-tot-E]|jgi:hypothetical protein|uniref:hypothetical protein n=1 Tax=Brevundimonas TaxID=41275 RepID=UPI00190897B5|nr:MULTISPECIES: hypothetical protein [Brevundimonas]MBK1969064.1 hypothetical protein [Brevundimonas diminuta]MBK1974369.1 hypothetical protein [Brevundimonas diminuta]MDM8354116.1 hypothetical protein [Brevundimonas diminuta]
MTRAPQPPKEQRSFADRGAQLMDAAAATAADRRDWAHGVQSGQPGDADVNLSQQGRYGNLQQNLTTHRKTHP